MRKALAVSTFALGALLAGALAQASTRSSFTTAIAGTTTSVVKSGSVTVTLCTTVNGISTCADLSKPVATICPAITLKQGPQTIKASCSTGLNPTAFDAAILVNGALLPTICSGLIGNTVACNGVSLKIGK